MNVLVDSSVFTGALVAESLRLRLLIFNIEGRHRVVVSGTRPEFTAWLAQQSPNFQEAWATSEELSAREAARDVSAQTIRVLLTPAWNPAANVPEVDVVRAVALLEQPLRLYLESVNSDGDFLLCVAQIGGRRALLDRYRQANQLELVHGGGLGELETQLRRRLSEDPLVRLRMWVLFDSDSLRPNAPGRAPAALSRFCQGRSVRFHRLERRAIENYLPNDSLQRWTEETFKQTEQDERKRRQRAFSKLRSDQRFHFNMKDGLSGDSRRTDLVNRIDPATQRDLYDDLDAGTLEALQQGFGGSSSERFRTDERITETSLRNDGQQSEIGSMLDELFSLI